jgi:hypothetical protein
MLASAGSRYTAADMAEEDVAKALSVHMVRGPLACTWQPAQGLLQCLHGVTQTTPLLLAATRKSCSCNDDVPRVVASAHASQRAVQCSALTVLLRLRATSWPACRCLALSLHHQTL